MSKTFYNCKNLKTYSDSIDADGDFSKYVIPDSVTNMECTFWYCFEIEKAPTIPSNVDNMNEIFKGAKSLSGIIVINANPTYYDDCFPSNSEIWLTGSSDILNLIAASAYGDNVKVLN